MAVADRYELLEVVGSGGMATVWRARDQRLGRIVALKRPHPSPPDSDVYVRFEREARLAAAASHPHLVEVYDVGRDADGPFLVMEFVDAPSIGTARTSPNAVARVGAEIGEALAVLHAAGIVHRDVKPGNVLLAPAGAKLTDFGIAHAADSTALTQPGLTHGTPAYAAPEVLASGTHSPESDVYSLAAVVYEMLTGVRYAPVELGRLDPRWHEVLAPALAAQPEQRPSAAQLAAGLRRLHQSGVVAPPLAPTQAMPAHLRPRAVTPPADPRPNTAMAALALFLALVAVVAVVAYLATRGGDPAQSTASQTSAAGAAGPLVSAASSTLAPTLPPTAPPVTTAPPTVPPTPPVTTVPPSSTLPPTPEATRDALIRRVEASPDFDRGQGDGSASSRFEEHLDRAIEHAAQERPPNDIERQLKDAAQLINERVEDETARSDMFDLLDHLAAQLGVDPVELDDDDEGDD